MRTEVFLIAIYGLMVMAAGASTLSSFGMQQSSEARSIIQQAAVAEEYAVYAALIERMYVRKEVELIVIRRRTSAYSSDPGKLGETLERVRKRAPKLKPATMADFQSKNNQPSLLDNFFDIKARVLLISAEEVKPLFGRGGGSWEAFYQKYPKSQGLLTLSQVGFNPEKKQALVYVGNQRWGLAGEGSYILLTREEDDDWVIADNVGMWVS